MVTINDIKSNYAEHHTSRARGYISRKTGGIVKPYKGRFGKGYKVYTPAYDSTRYCFITYYVKEVNDK